MAEPSVACIMLTRDRPELAMRAVECWDKQTYANKCLHVLDTGDESCGYLGDYDGVHHIWADLSLQSWPIGKLRNEANRVSAGEIIIHFDDDDWSHPSRIAEKVALLQSSGADCVGYRECLFWREATRQIDVTEYQDTFKKSIPVKSGEAWLYQNGDKRYAIGSSLCYWRKAWESRPFSETNGPKPRVRGEDRVFIEGLKSVIGASALMQRTEDGIPVADHGIPRMICRIHDGNQHNYQLDDGRLHYKRVPQWDDYCRRIMDGDCMASVSRGQKSRYE